MIDQANIHDDDRRGENFPAKVFLACPDDLLNPKFIRILNKRGWNSVLCLATMDVNILVSLKGAKTIYFVISKCIESSAFIDMILKTLRIIEGSDCKCMLLKLDEPVIPPMLEVISQFPEDLSLQ